MEHTLIPCDTATILPIIKANREKLHAGLSALAGDYKKQTIDEQMALLSDLKSATPMQVLTGEVGPYNRARGMMYDGRAPGEERRIAIYDAGKLANFDGAISFLEGEFAPAFVNMAANEYALLVRFDLDVHVSNALPGMPAVKRVPRAAVG